MSHAQQTSQVLIVGLGGVGIMAAYALETGGLAEVTAVCRSNYDAIVKSGIAIDSIDHGQKIQNWRPSHVRKTVPTATEEGVQYDFIVATTKNTPDIRPTLLEVIEPAVTPGHTAIVLLQNGINIERPVVERFPSNVVLSGVSLIQVAEKSPGYVLQDDVDKGRLGPFPNQALPFEVTQAAAHRFLDLYSACGKVHWEYDEDVNFSRWRKLVYNSAFNSVSAVLGIDTTRMRMSRFMIDLLVRPAMREIIAVAAANGVHLPDGWDDIMIRQDNVDAFFVPSMGQDVAKDNFIELETIVGEPVREAEKAGVPVPTLRTIYGFLKGLQLKNQERKGMWEPRFEDGNPYA